MHLPANLSREASADLEEILTTSLKWGPKVARKTRERLVMQMERIAAGISLGHKRADVPFKMPTLCVTESPFVIIYDPETRIVLRIIDGRRDFASLLGSR